MSKLTLRTKLCDMLGIEYPIICAGMGDILKDGTYSTGKMAAAVANAGGLGMIGGGMMSPEALLKEIREAKRLTTRPFGVDLVFPVTEPIPDTMDDIMAKFPSQLTSFVDQWYNEYGVPRERGSRVKVMEQENTNKQWEVVKDEGVKILALGLGTPDWVVSEAHARGMKIISLIGNTKQARMVNAVGPDIIVAQGYESGGHTGRIGLMALVPQVIAAVSPTPVVAAGGIVHGSQIAAVLTLGAVGVWAGTVFLASKESVLHDKLKQKLIEADEETPRITRVFTGKTARALRNPMAESWEKAGLPTLPLPLQTYLVRDFLYSVEKHKPELMMAGCGQGVGMIMDIKSIEQVVNDLVRGATESLNKYVPANVTTK